ncbi:type II toxin-antitoxin system VapC family toxin [Geminicoccus harenae]|uniref:type II toxin-antitoxin system VapC family toxin n=1 Tax=Geminicoccus harenae TaxID=2498453 RepID=UPI00168ADF33|nr:type II toxin-antitoxin system VapC family toxin [Geminicoccus harenae]
MFLLDTNVVSDLRERARADPRVRAWALAHPVSEFAISAVTILELEFGVCSLARRDPAQGLVLRRWLNDMVLARFEGRILPVDIPVAIRAAHLHVIRTHPQRDALIGATAYVHGLTLVTRNIRDFEDTEVDLLNPWIG